MLLVTFLVCIQLPFYAASQVTKLSSRSRASIYIEHLEVAVDDEADTPPPWDADDTATARSDGDLGDSPEDLDWVPDAVRDVAYYLRQFKFNEYDRRYHGDNFTGERGFLGAFPVPPLRSLHWEVRDACDAGFVECLRYLQDKLTSVRLSRDDDTVKAMRDNQLSMPEKIDKSTSTSKPEEDDEEGAFESMEEKIRYENRKQVIALDRACLDLRAADENDFDGFLGPLDRFQWRTTASYYMCTFTMAGEAALRQLGEPCDNFAWCLDWDLGPAHGDPRAQDSVLFQCARHSFCPDPCCPLRVVRSEDDCLKDNPCRFATADPEGLEALEASKRPRCSLASSSNANLRGMMENHWNTSCACAEPGHHWEARFGFCVDTNECEHGDPCNDRNHEECVNTLGSFRCRCRWGWRRGRSGECRPDPTSRMAASVLRGGAERPDEGPRRGVWDVLEDILLPQE